MLTLSSCRCAEMRQFQTSVLELRTAISSGFATEPYECGWASEAIFFIRAESEWPPDLEPVIQISADGIRWLDDGEGHRFEAPTGGFVRAGYFGGWLRVRFQGAGEVVGSIRLALKE